MVLGRKKKVGSKTGGFGFFACFTKNMLQNFQNISAFLLFANLKLEPAVLTQGPQANKSVKKIF